MTERLPGKLRADSTSGIELVVAGGGAAFGVICGQAGIEMKGMKLIDASLPNVR